MSRVGMTVLYTLSEGDVREIVERRRLVGASIARGNEVRKGQEYPALICADWGGSVNLRVWLDGYDEFWGTSRPEWTEDRVELILYAIDAEDGGRYRLTNEQTRRLTLVDGQGYEGATYNGHVVEVERIPTHDFTWRPLEVAAPREKPIGS